MNLKICNSCGRELTNSFHYTLTVDTKERNKHTTNVDYIDLCPACYEKLIKEAKQFKYGKDTIAEMLSEGVMTQNFVSREEILALQTLVEKYYKNKIKIRKILDNFLYMINSRISHEATQEEIDNIVALAVKWEENL